MGFIDKALAKTKALKEKAAEDLSQTAEPILTPPPRLGAVLPKAKIRYTVTRTAPVQAETLRRHRIITGNLDDPALEEYKILRTQILRTKLEQKNTLMITGPSAGEGKTVTAINLAVSLAQELNKIVLLVDAVQSNNPPGTLIRMELNDRSALDGRRFGASPRPGPPSTTRHGRPTGRPSPC